MIPLIRLVREKNLAMKSKKFGESACFLNTLFVCFQILYIKKKKTSCKGKNYYTLKSSYYSATLW